MNKPDPDLITQLQALNELLIRERRAIIQLRIDRLGAIQEEKIGLLKVLHQAQPPVDPGCTGLIIQIRTNNDRNRHLLQSGLKLIAKLQDNLFRRLALTYAAHGRSLQMGAGPRLLNRSA